MPLVALLAPAAVHAQARFEGLGFLRAKDTASWAEGVSGDGSVVVGHSLRGRGRQAFRWTEKEGMEAVGRFSPRGISHAHAASDGGDVIVGDVARRTPWFGFVFYPTLDAASWSRARGGRLPRQRGGSIATDVSADGSIVCGIVYSDGAKAIIWSGGGKPISLGDPAGSDGRSRALGISADGSVVVGSVGQNLTQAFRWTAGAGMVGLGTLPGRNASYATAVSANGATVVGASGVLGGDWEAFRWTEAEGMVGLGDLPGGYLNSSASDVSGDGSRVIGRGALPYDPASPFKQVAPFIWDSAHGMRELSGALTGEYGLDLTGWTRLEATGISDDGTVIVGTDYGTGGADYTEAWRAVIPGP